jgi:MscS family membrane protein
MNLQDTFLDNSLQSIFLFTGIILTGMVLKRFFSHQISGLIYRLIKRYTTGVSVKEFRDILYKPMSLFILLVTLFIAFRQLHFPVEWEIPSEEKFGVRFILWKAFILSLFLSITWLLLRVVDFFGLVLLHRARLTNSKADDQLIPFIKESIKVIVLIMSFFLMLGTILHVNVASLIAGLGIGGLAIALAAKDTLENLLGSFAIFLDKPFSIGDTVKVNLLTGKVERIGFRSTQIRTQENTIITIPNKQMTDAALENISLRKMIRGAFTLTLRLDTPKEKIEHFSKKLLHSLSINNAILGSPVPLVRLEKISETGLELSVQFYVDTVEFDEFTKVRQEVLFTILNLAQEAAIRLDTKTPEFIVNSK